MDPGLRRVLVFAAAAGAVGAVSLALPSPWDLIAVVPWMLALGGPLALFALQPALARDARTWAWTLGLALPGLAVAAAAREVLHVASYVPGPAMGARQAVRVGVHLLWLLVTVALAGRAVAGLGVRARGFALAFAAAAALAAIVVDLMPVLILAEVIAVVAVARFRRAPEAWSRATLAAAGVLGLGLLLLFARRPTWPPRIVLDDVAFGLGVLPLVAAAGIVFLATLVLRAPRAESAA